MADEPTDQDQGNGAEREWRPKPARRYSWAPFEPGHMTRLAHGARTPAIVDPAAAELVEAVLAERPDLQSYPEAVAAWARAEVRCVLYAHYHAEAGLLDEDGYVRGGSHVFTAENAAAKLRERLGLDPLSDAELASKRTEAVQRHADLDAMRARGRAVIEAQTRGEVTQLPTGNDAHGHSEDGGSP